MFTNEFEFDETVTTVLDDDGKYEDVQLFIDDNEVYIRQWNERTQRFDLIVLGHKMFKELIEALNHTEGAYLMDIKKSV